MRRILWVALAIGLITWGQAFAGWLRPRPLATDDPIYLAIADTLRRYQALEAEAVYTLDDSRLSEVLANDRRGGLAGGADLNAYYLRAVRWHTGQPDLRGDEFGLLDFRRAYYAYLREVRRIYSEALATGEISAETAPFQLPAVEALMRATGMQVASLPPPKPEVIEPADDYLIYSIAVKSDLAYMRVEFPCAQSELIFAELEGHWYYIGGRRLKYLGCG
jgi:hypothetical protein